MAVLADKLQNAWHTWGKGHYSHFRGEKTGKLTCFIGRLIHPEGQQKKRKPGSQARFLAEIPVQCIFATLPSLIVLKQKIALLHLTVLSRTWWVHFFHLHFAPPPLLLHPPPIQITRLFWSYYLMLPSCCCQEVVPSLPLACDLYRAHRSDSGSSRSKHFDEKHFAPRCSHGNGLSQSKRHCCQGWGICHLNACFFMSWMWLHLAEIETQLI